MLWVTHAWQVLPERHRATQTEAFGKRGKSLHGACALRWDPAKQDFTVLNVRVACDDSNQTWFHTLNALRTTLDEVIAHWSDLSEATLQSDGAQNYDCTAFMTTAPRLFEAAGLKLMRHTITEVGDGKNLVDTDFQQAQMSLNHGLDGGRDFEDAQGILDTLEANKTLGVVNVGMKLGARTLEPKKGKGPKAYTGINSIYDREYEYDSNGHFTGVRMRKFFGLGAGRLVTAKQLRALWRQDFDAGDLKPEKMMPSNGSRPSAAKVKLSYEHNLKRTNTKHFQKQQREARAAEAQLEAAADDLRRTPRVTTFSCQYLGCPHRPFMTQAGADAHACTCILSGNGKRKENECWVKLRVSSHTRVTLQLNTSTAGHVGCSVQLSHVKVSSKVLRPFKPANEYGLQPHRAVVHYKTPEATQLAAQTVVSKTVALALKVVPTRQGPRVQATIGSRKPPLLTPGWAIRPPQERRRFTSEQRSFLVKLYDWPHGRLNEHQAYAKFREQFNANDGAYSRQLRLSRAQIKAFFSTEKARRLKAGVAAAVEAKEAAPAANTTPATNAAPTTTAPATAARAASSAPAADPLVMVGDVRAL